MKVFEPLLALKALTLFEALLFKEESLFKAARAHKVQTNKQTNKQITAGFLSRAGAETPLNFREKFRVFKRKISSLNFVKEFGRFLG